MYPVTEVLLKRNLVFVSTDVTELLPSLCSLLDWSFWDQSHIFCPQMIINMKSPATSPFKSISSPIIFLSHCHIRGWSYTSGLTFPHCFWLPRNSLSLFWAPLLHFNFLLQYFVLHLYVLGMRKEGKMGDLSKPCYQNPGKSIFIHFPIKWKTHIILARLLSENGISITKSLWFISSTKVPLLSSRSKIGQKLYKQFYKSPFHMWFLSWNIRQLPFAISLNMDICSNVLYN